MGLARLSRGRWWLRLAALDLVLFVAVLQVGLTLHIRNTLISCASEGARLGAREEAPLSTLDLVRRYADLRGEIAEGATVGGARIGGLLSLIGASQSSVPSQGIFG